MTKTVLKFTLAAMAALLLVQTVYAEDSSQFIAPPVAMPSVSPTSGDVPLTGTLDTAGTDEPDTIPPHTIIDLQGTIGNNNWYTSGVTITLVANDPYGSGVATTEYSLDDGKTWNFYTAPFTISTEGTITLLYRSIDWAGNVETPNPQTIPIDRTPPAITITSPADGAVLSANQEVSAAYTAADSVSGVDSVSGNVLNGGRIDTSVPGSYTFTVTATDKAGNTGSKTSKYVISIIPVKVTVKVTIVPRVINLGGNGAFIAFVKLPKGYKASDIDKTSVQCEGANAKRVITNKIFPQVFGAIFKTSELKGVSSGDRVTLTVTGYLKNNGNPLRFEGSDTVKVIKRQGKFTDEFEDWNKARDEDLFAKNYKAD
jgi:hypothetical protein